VSLLVVGFLPHAPAGVALFLSLKIFRLEWLNVVIGGGGGDGGIGSSHGDVVMRSPPSSSAALARSLYSAQGSVVPHVTIWDSKNIG